MESDFSDDESSSRDHIQNKGNFHGCYLLVSNNPKYLGKVYIGYTVNPNRRIKQHNKGHFSGGARKTSGRGPWDMILIIHGFPSDISALRFEWAWQHPRKSRRINQAVSTKKSTESFLEHKLRIVAHMLSVTPWNKLPLTIRWLKQEYEIPFDPQMQPPLHMPIAYGLVDIQPVTATSSTAAITTGSEEDREQQSNGNTLPDCGICSEPITVDNSASPPLLSMSCYHKDCSLSAHVTCLANKLCEADQILPITGDCPSCKQNLLWGELVRRLKQQQLLTDHQGNSAATSQETSSQTVKTKKPRAKKKATAPHWSEELNLT